MNRLIVRIERMVLTGLRPQDRQPFAAGFQHELARVLARHATVSRLRDIGAAPRFRVASVRVGDDATPHRIGERVAQSIGGGLIK